MALKVTSVIVALNTYFSKFIILFRHMIYLIETLKLHEYLFKILRILLLKIHKNIGKYQINTEGAEF
jgi:hypothetical protein